MSGRPSAMPSFVRITAPCRIHFGLLSLAEVSGRKYGGAGVMLEEPSSDIVFGRCNTNSISGLYTERVEHFLTMWRQHTGIQDAVSCEVRRAPPEHVGLGLGTQLGLSVAWALDSLFGRDEISLEERARSVGRGNRSAVGTWGFSHGGMIVDAGKTEDQSLGELRESIRLPDEWCVLLVQLQACQGLAGQEEISAFSSLPPVSDSLREKLGRELWDRLVPAARSGDFETFAESVYQYGYAAGECFSVNQGGPFLTTGIAEFVSFCRETGVPGVGQSSWGPTVYCWFPNQESAEAFRSLLDEKMPNSERKVVVSKVASRGAQRNFGD